LRDFKNSKKALEDEYDAYRRINELNEDLASAMEDIAAAKEAAYGAEYLALLDAEISGLETENKLLDETIKLADKRAASKKKELENDYGAKFDDFGNISNYNEI
jgi:metal-dependent amidase/aminoacylase/carboxypeptidase family protein